MLSGPARSFPPVGCRLGSPCAVGSSFVASRRSSRPLHGLSGVEAGSTAVAGIVSGSRLQVTSLTHAFCCLCAVRAMRGAGGADGGMRSPGEGTAPLWLVVMARRVSRPYASLAVKEARKVLHAPHEGGARAAACLHRRRRAIRRVPAPLL
uniref:Uncharacterized protein n=1 Tax=Arundo donax TaxID=35708 RepID=A0A0A9H3B9_ARUDO